VYFENPQIRQELSDVTRKLAKLQVALKDVLKAEAQQKASCEKPQSIVSSSE